MIITLSLLCLALGRWALLVAGAYLVYYSVVGSTVNGLCHWRGYKTYRDAHAYNNRLVAVLSAGEGLHNNRHRQPRNPRFRTGDRRLEFDSGWLFIRFLCWIGQAEVA